MKRTITKAVLPVGGLGTRFLPATKASPKEMLPIVDKPMVQYAVEEAVNVGINDFLFVTGKNKRAIEDHFDAAYELEESLKKSGKDTLLKKINELEDVNFAYIRQRTALGLGHAILCAEPYMSDEAFAVLLSDDLIPQEECLLGNMLGLYEKLKGPVLCVMEVDSSEIHRYGVIDGEKLEDGTYKVNGMVEKPTAEEAPSNLAVIGRYILTSDIFGILKTQEPGKGGEIQLTDALETQLKQRPVYAYQYRGKRYDGGNKLGFLKATVDLALNNGEVSGEFREYLIETVKRLEK